MKRQKLLEQCGRPQGVAEQHLEVGRIIEGSGLVGQIRQQDSEFGQRQTSGFFLAFLVIRWNGVLSRLKRQKLLEQCGRLFDFSDQRSSRSFSGNEDALCRENSALRLLDHPKFGIFIAGGGGLATQFTQSPQGDCRHYNETGPQAGTPYCQSPG